MDANYAFINLSLWVINMKLQKIRFAVQLTIFAIGFTAFFHTNFWWIEIMFIALAILAGAFACGWTCPFGMAQDIFSYIGSLFVKKKLKLPVNMQQYLVYLRYILALLFFILAAYQIFYFFPYDARLIFFSVVAMKSVKISLFAILAFFLIGSMFYDRLFCNYVCPNGAKLGALSLLRIFTLKRNQNTCIKCHKCSQVCPMNVNTPSKQSIRSPHCINCFKCISHCPIKNTLKFGLITQLYFKAKGKNNPKQENG